MKAYVVLYICKYAIVQIIFEFNIIYIDNLIILLYFHK